MASFDPTSQERRRLYTLYQPNGVNQNVSSTNTATQSDADEQFGAYTQGVHEDSLVFSLSPMQIGTLLTLATPMKGYALRHGASLTLRRPFGLVIKKLINDDLTDQDESGWTNVLTALPFVLLRRLKDSHL